MVRALPPDALPSVLGDLPLAACAAAHLPLNDTSELETPNAGSHWTLLVFLRDGSAGAGSAGAAKDGARRGRFVYMDSMSAQVPSYALRLAAALWPLLVPEAAGERPQVEALACPRQGNAVDCGVHVVANAERVAEWVAAGEGLQPEKLPRAEDMRAYRAQLKVSHGGLPRL